ncbi:MAG: GDCCVxC domain-containing (seleno)protein [Burkholderiaceae bacterium]
MTNRKTSVTGFAIRLTSTITCPKCGHNETETMPTDSCWFFYECQGCAELLKPSSGHCCVFCAYGTVACPPVQLSAITGQAPDCCR